MFIDRPEAADADDSIMDLFVGLERLKDIAISLDDTAKAESFKRMFDDCLENYCDLKRRQLERTIAEGDQPVDRKRA